jgi:hypothetical protein
MIVPDPSFPGWIWGLKLAGNPEGRGDWDGLAHLHSAT